MNRKFFTEESMEKRHAVGERVVGGMNTVIHCHHYNSRVQNTIEGSQIIDGSQIFQRAAEAVFYRQLKTLTDPLYNPEEYIPCAAELYSYLGFGFLNFDQFGVGCVTSNSSHFVNGWNVGFKAKNQKVCSFTQGYIQAVYRLVNGKSAKVEETQCMAEGADHCSFQISQCEDNLLTYETLSYRERAVEESLVEPISTNNVDMMAIREAVFGLPIYGNEEGLIPAFNVYLAHMPKDFYNLVSLLFIEEMRNAGMEDIGIKLLEQDAETCAMNTFSGIMNSDEWMAVIQPMITHPEDNLFGLLGVANALGWGVIELTMLKPWERMIIQSVNGYEAEALEVDGKKLTSKCPMLSGVASGLMALVFGDGEYKSRMGTFKTFEDMCLSLGDPYCRYDTTLASVLNKVD